MFTDEENACRNDDLRQNWSDLFIYFPAAVNVINQSEHPSNNIQLNNEVNMANTTIK